ncbi:hemin-degrading factor [Qingshengfaniella alkalisoli]|uniref:Hemin-degrading factor n=1 Tax=Qingshengfaniella alkalisoli TaxID=2599296 RepID=A0A5B8IS37_9RHOB|nr:ChuX/HutX family heme-like substrate-binding protein [Qingshengfaniella alkalisoli]QDY68233.1 hemin-degrading factor [Qingshengfaniella alkalisoli]
MSNTSPSAAEIRLARQENPKARERDLSESLGITEAQLVAAHVGHGATAVTANPDQLIAAAERLGEVMALTRTLSVVHEKVGTYANYRSGPHASAVIAEEIDLRLFPKHWCHAFAVEKEGEDSPRRSLQIFDAAGDAVHKIHLRNTSNHDLWDDIIANLKSDAQFDTLAVQPRQAPEGPKSNHDKLDILRDEWNRMSDTHQFLRLTSKLKMNRLGAYRIAGEPFVRALAPGCIPTMMDRISESGTPVMIFVGNRGCIQIHSGPIEKIVPMGPWLNVMDPRFNLHLRADHVAEVWAVEKPTQRGPAISVEAFDKHGTLIMQVFGVRKQDKDFVPQWREIMNSLPSLEPEAV